MMPTVQRSAWYGHSEAILQSMLCSEDDDERKKAVELILKIREAGDRHTQIGDRSLRPRKPPGHLTWRQKQCTR